MNQRRHLELLLNRPGGHIVAVNPHHCRFGNTHQPVCVEDGCGYVGPFVNEARAREIAEEHRSKTLENHR